MVNQAGQVLIVVIVSWGTAVLFRRKVLIAPANYANRNYRQVWCTASRNIGT